MMMTPSHRLRSRWRLMLAAAVTVAVLVTIAVWFVWPSPARFTADMPVASTQVAVPSRAESPAASINASQPPATATPRASPGLAPLAGRIRPNVAYHGKATFYDAGDGGGACLFGPASDLMIGAMNETDYESAKACGAYVLVTAANGASVTVRITNLCPLPCAPGQIDLSPEAFGKLAEHRLGEVPITWKLLSPSVPGTISIRYKAGSSQWWCGIQAIGHRNPLALLEVRTSGGWRQLPRASYNYFISDKGSGCGGAIRITDIYGEQLTINGIALSPDVAQPTQVQFAKH